MKSEIKEYMDARIHEVRNQNTIFDIAVSAVEDKFEREMTANSATRYTIDACNTETVDVYLDESLYHGMTTVAINRQSPNGLTRLASMTITSTGVIQETFNDIDDKTLRQTIYDLFTDIYDAVRALDATAEESGDTE